MYRCSQLSVLWLPHHYMCYGTYLIDTYIITCVIFTYIITYVIDTCIITYILLVAYVWTHDVQCSFYYLAVAFIVVFLELLLIAFHVCPQISVQNSYKL